MAPRPKRLRGFTYIELLVTLTIIGLLISVLFPSLIRGMQAARRSSCLSNLKQLGTALHLYAMDHNGRFPPGDHDWAAVIPSVKNTAVFKCPDETGPAKSWAGTMRTAPDGKPLLYSSYQYRGGLTSDGGAEEVLAADWSAWHTGGGNVLTLDSRTRWVPARELPRIAGNERPHP